MQEVSLKLKRLLKGHSDTWVRTFPNGETVVGFSSANPTKERQEQVIQFLRERGVQCSDSGNPSGSAGYCLITVSA